MTPHRRFNLTLIAVYLTAFFIVLADLFIWRI
jgi:hypothetical protein